MTYLNGRSKNQVERNEKSQFYWALNQRGSSNKAQNNLKCNSNFTIPYCLFQILLFEPNLRTNCEISDDFEYFEPRVKPISNVEDTGDNYCRLDSDNNVITSSDDLQLKHYKNLEKSDLVTINNKKPTKKGMISRLLKK